MAWEPATISAFAAAAAATAAAVVAAIQLYVGHRQTKAGLLAAQAALRNAESVGRHRRAENRRRRTELIRDTLSEYIAYLTPSPEAHTPQDRLRIETLRTKLILLLNPKEADAVRLLEITLEASLLPHNSAERSPKVQDALEISTRIFTHEWNQIKDLLG